MPSVRMAVGKSARASAYLSEVQKSVLGQGKESKEMTTDFLRMTIPGQKTRRRLTGEFFSFERPRNHEDDQALHLIIGHPLSYIPPYCRSGVSFEKDKDGNEIKNCLHCLEPVCKQEIRQKQAKVGV